jgi:phage gp45-like
MVEIRKLWSAIRNAAISSRVARTEDGGEHLVCQAADDDDVPSEDVAILQPYGLSANVPAGSSGAVLRLGGQSNNLVMLNASPTDGSRPSNESGEVKLWSIFGHEIHLKDDKSIRIHTGESGVAIDLNDDGSINIAAGGGSSITFSSSGGITITPGTGQSVKLGGAGAALAVARVTSLLSTSVQLAAWCATVESGFTSLLPGLFTPANIFVATAGLPGQLGSVFSGSSNVKST